MLRRYILPGVSLVVAALLTAVIADKATKVNYISTCVVRMTLPVTAAAGSGYFDLNEAIADTELVRVQRGPMFAEAARATGVDAASLAGNTVISLGPRGYFALVSVRDASAQRSPILTDAVCTQTVADLKTQRTGERAADADRQRAQLAGLLQDMDRLNAVPAAQRTTVQNSQLAADQQAVKTDEAVLANTLAAPPELIEVADAASPAVPDDPPSLSRNLLVAGAASLLGVFLIVIVGEVVRDRRVSSEG